MKRFLAAVSVVTLVFLLCGCGGKDIQENNSQINEVFMSDLARFSEESTETTTAATTAETTNVLEGIGSLYGKVILIDAGHGKADYTKKEPLAPDSDEMKAAFVAGTSGENQTEAELNLKVAKKLQAKLKAMGADVHMTRTGETTDKSNVERAQMGNRLNADMTVRIHANGSENSGVRGIFTMVPGNKYVSDDVVEKSFDAGTIIQKHLIKQTGAVDQGVQSRNDMTGFNWSEVPVVLVEMGYMTNPEEDKLLESSAYQDKIVQGIADGLVEYFE